MFSFIEKCFAGDSANAVPLTKKLRTRVTCIWGDRRGQPARSAMDRPRPGRTPLLIRVSPVPGKYASVFKDYQPDQLQLFEIPRLSKVLHIFLPLFQQIYWKLFVNGIKMSGILRCTLLIKVLSAYSLNFSKSCVFLRSGTTYCSNEFCQCYVWWPISIYFFHLLF